MHLISSTSHVISLESRSHRTRHFVSRCVTVSEEDCKKLSARTESNYLGPIARILDKNPSKAYNCIDELFLWILTKWWISRLFATKSWSQSLATHLERIVDLSVRLFPEQHYYQKVYLLQGQLVSREIPLQLSLPLVVLSMRL